MRWILFTVLVLGCSGPAFADEGQAPATAPPPTVLEVPEFDGKWYYERQKEQEQEQPRKEECAVGDDCLPPLPGSAFAPEGEADGVPQ